MSKKKPQRDIVEPREIERAVHVVRGQRIMLDSDLARLYGVTTAALNQAVKRNAEQFPTTLRISLHSKSLVI